MVVHDDCKSNMSQRHSIRITVVKIKQHENILRIFGWTDFDLYV